MSARVRKVTVPFAAVWMMDGSVGVEPSAAWRGTGLNDGSGGIGGTCTAGTGHGRSDDNNQ